VKPPKCDLCAKAEWRHVCAGFGPVVSATNAATNRRLTDATNTGREGVAVRGAGRVDRPEPVVGVVGTGGSGVSKTANRRTREAYNAYQREYMRLRRSAVRSAMVVTPSTVGRPTGAVNAGLGDGQERLATTLGGESGAGKRPEAVFCVSPS